MFSQRCFIVSLIQFFWSIFLFIRSFPLMSFWSKLASICVSGGLQAQTGPAK